MSKQGNLFSQAIDSTDHCDRCRGPAKHLVAVRGDDGRWRALCRPCAAETGVPWNERVFPTEAS